MGVKNTIWRRAEAVQFLCRLYDMGPIVTGAITILDCASSAPLTALHVYAAMHISEKVHGSCHVEKLSEFCKSMPEPRPTPEQLKLGEIEVLQMCQWCVQQHTPADMAACMDTLKRIHLKFRMEDSDVCIAAAIASTPDQLSRAQFR